MARIEFQNNQPCVDLIEKKPTGILPTLDEICMLGRETRDESFLDRLNGLHKSNDFYVANRIRGPRAEFSIQHFAGEVSYCVDGFIEKNSDTVYDDLGELLMLSQSEFVQTLSRPFVDGATSGGGGGGVASHGIASRMPGARGAGASRGGGNKKASSTIASKFKQQLAELYDTLLSTAPHYVRCIKPNKLKKAQVFDAPMILNQLLYSGVLETVRIRRQGFPFRESFTDFWRRCCRIGYNGMVPECAKLPVPPPAAYNDKGGT